MPYVSPLLLRLAAVLQVAYCTDAEAQTGMVVGTVVDRSGATVPRAMVRVTPQLQAGHIYIGRGDGLARFRLKRIEPGLYLVLVRVPGFVDKTVSDLRVVAGQKTDLGKIVLDVGCDNRGARCEGIEVTALDANGEDAAEPGSLTGKAVDTAGTYIPFARVRAMGQSTAYQAHGDALGLFRIAGIQPGDYSIHIDATGFRDKEISHVRVVARQRSDLGSIVLEVLRCDDPRVFCDTFDPDHDDPVHAEGVLEVPPLCSVDIDEGKTVCTEDREMDLSLRPGLMREVYILPLHGASLAHPRIAVGKPSCNVAVYSTEEVQIEGPFIFGHLCVHTSGGRIARADLFRPSDAVRENVQIRFISWAGKADEPASKVKGHP